MDERLKKILLLLLSILVELPIYIFLHEGAHVLVNLLCGAKITAFSMIGAYTSAVGGNYNLFTSSLLYVAGMLLPVLISICFMFFYQYEKEGIFYHFFSFYFVIVPIGSIIAWICIPIDYLRGSAPISDDVTQFINVSGIHPLIISFLAVVLFLLNIVLAWHKGMIPKWWRIMREK